MSAALLDFRPRPFGGGLPRKGAAPKVALGDEVTWTNPNTNEEWPELRVDRVFAGQAAALVYGCFGQMNRSGAFVLEQRRVRLEHCVVTRRAGERV